MVMLIPGATVGGIGAIAGAAGSFGAGMVARRAGLELGRKVGGDQESVQSALDPSRDPAVLLEKLERGELLTPEQIAILRDNLTKDEAEILLQEEDEPISLAPQPFDDLLAGIDQAIAGLMRAPVKPSMLSEVSKRIGELAQARSRIADARQGTLRLDENTVITGAMLERADPITRAQLEQRLVNEQRAVENEARTLLNQFGLQEYGLERARIADENATALSGFRARTEEVRSRLARDQLSIQQAVDAVNRMVQGLGRSEARAQFEIDTARAAAPLATVGGKTEFTGRDLGAGVTALQRQAGVRDPENAAALRFPGSMRLDPRGTLAQNDEALGVTGPLPQIPGLSVTDADIPRAPALTSLNTIRMPELLSPVTQGTIDIAGLIRAMAKAGAEPGAEPTPPMGRAVVGDEGQGMITMPAAGPAPARGFNVDAWLHALMQGIRLGQ